MGPTPGSWSQNLLGWGLGTCFLNRYCKYRDCSRRTAARSPVDPDSLALCSPHPSCLLSRRERGALHGPRCPTSPGRLSSSLPTAGGTENKATHDCSTIPVHVLGMCQSSAGSTSNSGIACLLPPNPAAPPQGPWPQPSGTVSASPPSWAFHMPLLSPGGPRLSPSSYVSSRLSPQALH